MNVLKEAWKQIFSIEYLMFLMFAVGVFWLFEWVKKNKVEHLKKTKILTVVICGLIGIFLELFGSGKVWSTGYLTLTIIFIVSFFRDKPDQ